MIVERFIKLQRKTLQFSQYKDKRSLRIQFYFGFWVIFQRFEVLEKDA